MKLAYALLLATLAAASAFAAPDSHFDGSANTVTSADAVMTGPARTQHSLGLTAGSPSRMLDQGEPPDAGNDDSGGFLGAHKTGLMAGAAGGAIGALLAFGLGWTPVGIAGLGLLGAGAGLSVFGGSAMERTAGAGLAGAGMGLALAVAIGATPFGWPMLALAAVGAASLAGAYWFLGGGNKSK